MVVGIANDETIGRISSAVSKVDNRGETEDIVRAVIVVEYVGQKLDVSRGNADVVGANRVDVVSIGDLETGARV